MKESISQAAEIVQHSPGVSLKVGLAASTAGGMTTAANASIEIATYIGFGLTAMGIIVSIVSAWLGWQNLKEKRRENDIKERELNGSNHNDQ